MRATSGSLCTLLFATIDIGTPYILKLSIVSRKYGCWNMALVCPVQNDCVVYHGGKMLVDGFSFYQDSDNNQTLMVWQSIRVFVSSTHVFVAASLWRVICYYITLQCQYMPKILYCPNVSLLSFVTLTTTSWQPLEGADGLNNSCGVTWMQV